VGYLLKILPISGVVEPGLLSAVRRLVDEVEYLNRAWEGNLEFATIKDCCWRAAEAMSYLPDGGDPKSWRGRKDFCVGKARGVLIQEASKAGTMFAFLPSICFKDPQAKPPVMDDAKLDKGVALDVIQNHDPTAKLVICACCGKKVSIKETSLAHNVISQQAWKAIIDASVTRFLTVVENGALSGKVSSYATLSKVSSGSALDRSKFDVHTSADMARVKELAKTTKKSEFGDSLPGDSAKQIERAGVEALRDLPPKSDPRNQKLFDLLFADSMIEKSSYAASDQLGRQCRDCEGAQGNATLVQRDQLVKSGDLPAIAVANNIKDPLAFVGPQLACLPMTIEVGHAKYQVLSRSEQDEAVKRTTLRQISRFALGIEKTIGDYAVELSRNVTNRGATGGSSSTADLSFPPLLALMLDHWNEFVWTFRSVALEIASVPYTGEFGKLKFEGGRAQ
jgi:hypothetical protein